MMSKTDKEDKNKKIMMALKYQSVFSTPNGMLVLFDILNNLGYWEDQIKEGEPVILFNAAKRILKRAGGLDPANVDNILTESFEMVDRS